MPNGPVADFNEANRATSSDGTGQWRVLHRLDDGFLLFNYQAGKETLYAPLFVEHIQIRQPPKLTEAQVFLQRNPNPARLTTTADKLRYYRFKNALRQIDVSDRAGIDRSTYIHYESGEHQRYPIDKLERIAALFHVDVNSLLDDYNRFLQMQGAQVRRIRKGLGLSQNELGARMGVHGGTVKKWEHDTVLMAKSTYERLLRVC